MNSLFASDLWHKCVTDIADKMKRKTLALPTHIVGIESRGFVIGAALSAVLGIPFVMVRKKGAKYPGVLLEETYELEYGSDTLTLQEGILGHTSRVVIADDLVATGGSMMATKRLIEQTGALVEYGLTVVNLKYINSTDMDLIEIMSVIEETQ